VRILQFITPARLGGAEHHVLQLCELLGARGHEVTVVCPRGRPLVPELARRGIPHLTPRTMGKLDLLTLWRLGSWLREGGYDLLHTHLSTASLLGSAAAHRVGVPVVATVHGLNRAFAFRRVGHLIAVSQAVRTHLVRQGIPANTIRVVYHGIQQPVAVPDGAQVRGGLGIPPDAFVIGVASRLRPEKGHRFLLEAAAQLMRQDEGQRTVVLLVGEGSERPALQAQAVALGIARHVHFTGFQAEVAPFLAAMDVCVVPSLKEGLSLVALEAMALARPVVASAVGGLPEVVEEGRTGLLVAPGQVMPLARALAKLAGDPETARAMGQAGRARVRRLFTVERMAAQTEDAYRWAIAEG